VIGGLPQFGHTLWTQDEDNCSLRHWTFALRAEDEAELPMQAMPSAMRWVEDHQHQGRRESHERNRSTSVASEAEVGRDSMKLEVHMIRPTSTDPRGLTGNWSEARRLRRAARRAPHRPVHTPRLGDSVTFGTGLTTAVPSSAEAGLTVSDIKAARDVGRGIDVTDVWQGPPPEGAATRPRTRAHRLRGPLLRRSRWQSLARPGGHHAAPRLAIPQKRHWDEVSATPEGSSARLPESLFSRVQVLETANE
jgi:hypothetical protein